MRVLKLIGCGVAFVLLSGCASILHGSRQQVSVTSLPPNARLTVDGQGSYTTPVTINLERKRDHSIVFELDGYHPEQVTINRVMSGAVAGNILAGGFIGWGIDAMTGAQYKLVPETVNVYLKPLAPGEQPAVVSRGAPTPEERLTSLGNLLAKDLITKDEYQTMKKKILTSMVD